MLRKVTTHPLTLPGPTFGFRLRAGWAGCSLGALQRPYILLFAECVIREQDPPFIRGGPFCTHSLSPTFDALDLEKASPSGVNGEIGYVSKGLD